MSGNHETASDHRSQLSISTRILSSVLAAGSDICFSQPLKERRTPRNSGGYSRPLLVIHTPFYYGSLTLCAVHAAQKTGSVPNRTSLEIWLLSRHKALRDQSELSCLATPLFLRLPTTPISISLLWD